MTKAAELAKMGEVITNDQIGGRRNIVINGAMKVAQRGTSETGVGAADGFFTCDRWGVYQGGTAGRLTMTQDSSGPSGFANSLKLDCTTADTSIAAGEYFAIYQRFEGQDVQQIKKGTSDAENITVSFYVKGNASATYAVELFDNDNTRQASQLFSVTTDWTRVVKTFTADTTGAFDDDTAQSLQLNFWIHAGSNLTSGTLNQTFAANDNTNRAVGISSFFDSTDRTFFLTGVQMEVGSVATPFEHRSFGEEQALCQRYFEVLFATRAATYASTGSYVQRQGHQMKVTKRALPTITDASNVYSTLGIDVTWEAANNQSHPNIEYIWGVISNASSGEFGRYDRKLTLDAEL